jgi:hypothetical protein
MVFTLFPDALIRMVLVNFFASLITYNTPSLYLHTRCRIAVNEMFILYRHW